MTERSDASTRVNGTAAEIAAHGRLAQVMPGIAAVDARTYLPSSAVQNSRQT
jgi:hypothetical protein